MQKTLQRAGNILLRSAALLVLIMCGCENATVYVSHPEVFTRERLLMSRQRELQFLDTALQNTPTTGGFQGAIQQNILNAFQGTLTGTITSTPTASTQPSAPTVNLSTFQLPGATTQATASNITGTGIDRLNDQLAYRDAVNAVIREKELDDTHDLYGHTLYTLKFDSALLTGSSSSKDRPVVVKITMAASQPSAERVKQEYKAWLNFMNGRLEHEEDGLAGRVQFNKITSSDTDTVTTYLFEGNSHFLEYLLKSLPANAPADLPGRIKNFSAAVNNDTGQFVASAPDKQAAILKDQSAAGQKKIVDIVTGFKLALDAKYAHDFSGLLSVDYTRPQDIGVGFSTTETVQQLQNDSAHQSLVQAINLEASWKTSDDEFANQVLHLSNQSSGDQDLYVDSIDPSEYAQNISDLSNETNVLSLSLALSAIIGKAANVGATAQSLNESQVLLQAVKRKPLALGFRDGQTFGWLLGAPFGIDSNHQPVFAHVPVRQSFAVSIVAPVSLQSLNLTATASWLNEDGTVSSSDLTVSDATHNVLLPTDLEALTTAISRIHSPRETNLSIAPSTGWALRGGSTDPQTLLIFGQNLWRNPQVFVNSQEADTVDVLADMKGLLAHFNKFPSMGTTETNADLSVVTSQDDLTVPNGVRIIPAAQKTAPPVAVVTSSYVVAGTAQGFTFSIDPAVMPTGFYKLILQVRPKDSAAAWTQIDTSQFARSTDKKTYAIKIPQALASLDANAPTPVTVDLRLQETPLDEPIDLLSSTPAADKVVEYFPKADQEKVVVDLATPTLSFDKTGKPNAASITLDLAPNVSMDAINQAYPGLAQSIQANTATFSMVQVMGQTTTWNVRAAPSGKSFVVVVGSVPVPANGDYTTLQINYKTQSNSPASVVVSGDVKVQSPS